MELSLVAELFVIAIDPQTGRLVKRRRRRFRKALARAAQLRGPGAATRARRRAVGELRAAGKIERAAMPGRHTVVPNTGAYKPMGRVRRQLLEGRFDTPRDVELALYLAWTGILARRLAKSERRLAFKRLKALFAAPEAQESELAMIPAWAGALGQVFMHEELDMLQDAIGDLVGDLFDGADGGGDGGDFVGGGFDGGGFDGGGGGGYGSGGSQ